MKKAMREAYIIAYYWHRSYRAGRLNARQMRRHYNAFKRLGYSRAWYAAEQSLDESRKPDMYESKISQMSEIPF